ncbi:MAG: carboxylesterase family protein [Actinomycetaceae bacterium]|nr:carboxylesterase family protein [Actinomycetaceae bacterium]
MTTDTTALPADPPIVHAPCGPLGGLWRPTSNPQRHSAAFLGIPFAQAPIGDLRFRAPVRALPWSEVRDATAYGPTPQRRPFADDTTIPEPSYPGTDTLNVNVFTPQPGNTEAALPVLVWIHGGGFFAGSPSSPWYDGNAFNRDGIVTVSISYRLGFDGFGWIEDAPLNRGLLDQICALEWVRDNIAAFGGDPNQVTIAGQSAGGGSVMSLLASPLAAGLFSSVISHSGAAPDIPVEQAKERGLDVAEKAGVEPTIAGWSALSEDKVLEATGVPFGNLNEFIGPIGRNGSSISYGPTIDGEVLPQGVNEAVAAGVGKDIRLIIGDTEHEFTGIGHAFSAPNSPFAGRSAEEVLTELGRDPQWVKEYIERYSYLGNDYLIIGQVLTHSFFHAATQMWAEIREKTGAADTWRYRFRLRDPHGLSGHCLELPFTFDCLETEGVEKVMGPNPPQALADEAHAAWVAFISGDNPWPRWSEKHEAFIMDSQVGIEVLDIAL